MTESNAEMTIGNQGVLPQGLERLAVVTRKSLAELGYPRSVIDRAFRDVPNIALPGSHRRLILVDDFERYIREHIYGGDRVR